jgi:serine/threonine-protein kinase HipA
MNAPRAARVYLDGQPVGRIEETPTGSRFTYDATYLCQTGAVPVSKTLPLQKTAHEAVGLHPFFENLLPEGWFLEISTKKLKLGADDAFGLLLATCGDCIGAVEVEDERATQRKANTL